MTLSRLGGVVAVFAAMTGCMETTPLTGGPSTGEDAQMLALAEAWVADDCEEVERLALGFETGSDARFLTVTTWLGTCLYDMDRFAEAVDVLSRVSEEPGAAEATYVLGRSLYALDAFSASGDTLKTFVARFPSHRYLDDAWYYVGKSALQLGQHDDAIAAFEQVLAMADASAFRHAGAVYSIGKTHADLGEWDAAIAAYEWVLAAYAESIYADNAAYQIAKVPYHRGYYVDASASLGAFIDTWPSSSWVVTARYFLGRSLYATDALAEALIEFELVAADVDSTWRDNATYYAGRCHYRVASSLYPAGWSDAVVRFDLLRALWPDSSYYDDASYFRARALDRLGKDGQAEIAYVALVHERPDSPYVDNAWYRLVRLRLALGNCEGAWGALNALAAVDEGGYLAKANATFADSACPVVLGGEP